MKIQEIIIFFILFIAITYLYKRFVKKMMIAEVEDVIAHKK